MSISWNYLNQNSNSFQN